MIKENVLKKIADISKYQGNVDWSKTKDDVEFVILRASWNCSATGSPAGKARFFYAPMGRKER